MIPKHLNPETFDKMLEGLKKLRDKDEWALVCEVMARAGMRSGELLKLDRYHDVNLEHGTLNVHAIKGSNDRSVPMPKDVLRAILTDFHIPSQADAKNLTRLIRRHWNRLRQKILGHGYGHCSSHGARASFAVAVYKRAGKDIVLVQGLLGHKSLGSTSAYLKIVEAEEKAQDILAAVGGKK